MPFGAGAADIVSMDPIELEILQRFDESRNAYNKATGLLRNGRSDEAEALLRQALALYPREIFMNQDLQIDRSVLESYDLLFSNIRERLQMIERDRELPPRLDPKAVKSLQDLIERNQGEAPPPPRRPGMRTQAAGVQPKGVPIPPASPEPGSAVLDLDQVPDLMSHDQIVRELEVAVRDANPFKAPAQGDPGSLEEGEVDEFDIDITGQGDTHPDANRDTENFDDDEVFSEPSVPEPRLDVDTSAADTALAAEIYIQSGEDEPIPEPETPEPAAPDAGLESDTILEDADAGNALDAAEIDALITGAEDVAEPDPIEAQSDTVLESGDLGAEDLEALVLEDELAAEPESESLDELAAAAEEEIPETEPEPQDMASATASEDKPRDAFDDLTPIYKDESPASPAMPEVKESEIKPPRAQAAQESFEASPLPEPVFNAVPAEQDTETPAPMETEADELESATADEQPGRGLMGFFDKFKNMFKRKQKDAFDQMLAGEEPSMAEDQPAAGEERMDASEMAAVAVEEPVAAPEQDTPAPAPPQQPGQQAVPEHGEEEALEDESVVAEMVKIDKPREHKVHMQVYDGGRTARLLANVLVLAVFGVGLLAAYMLVKPSVQLSAAYEATTGNEPAQKAGVSSRIGGLLWGTQMITTEGEQRQLTALDIAAQVIPATPEGKGLISAAAASAMADSLQNKNPELGVRIGRWAQNKGFSNPVVADLEFRSLAAAAEQARAQKKYDTAKKYIQNLDSLLKTPEFPTPGLHGFAISEARRVEFLTRAHAAGAALTKGRAEQAFGEIEPLLNSDSPMDPGMQNAFAELKRGIRDALLEQARKTRDEQGDAAAAQILMQKAGLLGSE